MTFLKYADRKFNAASLQMIGQANAIIEEYQAQNLMLSLRQLYYQFVARGMFENVVANYNRLGKTISEGRIAGLVSWTAIEDRGRTLRGVETNASLNGALLRLRETFRLDLWKDQPNRVEIWPEKQAFEGVLEPICSELRVDFFATRGYNSQSEQWAAARRFSNYIAAGQRPIVLHMADHDPSGIDMTRDIRERLELFVGIPVLVIRIALNMEQVEELRPPENPAKIADPRAADYIARFGESSWEMDALDPRSVRNLIADSVARFRDDNILNQSLAAEAAALNDLDVFIEENK